MEAVVSKREVKAEKFYYAQRAVTLLMLFFIFFPSFNPARICEMISKNTSLFTSGISYGSLTSEMGRAFRMGWISEGSMVITFIGSMLMLIGIAFAVVSACMSLGNLKMKKKGSPFALIGGLLAAIGLVLIYIAYTQVSATSKPAKVLPMFPKGFYVYAFFTIVLLISSVTVKFTLPDPDDDMKPEMESKYKLFLMFLPFALLCFVFSYLPLYGWRYAFFDYTAGGTLSMDNFVGFKWFTTLFQSKATRSDVVRVLRNTLVMSGLGIATSWVPMAFAIMLNEIKNKRFRRFIQTFTTIPNFISWVLVYAIALAIFSTDGFINTFASAVGLLAEGEQGTNYLMSTSGIWIKMLLWGMWKGVGWSAIIYIAGISGIDQQLYEAAKIDGAGRFQRMWHITLPGLAPTYCVMLLMSVANILSNGMDQYLVFENANNQKLMQVLDLYVYELGITGGNIPLSTVVGMVKSIVSIILLFGANRISKAIRGESIV